MKIETHDLIKRYGSRTVVDHVNVEVEQGSIVGLLGPNGAGKTTTFYMIVGIIQPDEGDVTVDGRSISGMPSTSATSSGSATCRRKPPYSER